MSSNKSSNDNNSKQVGVVSPTVTKVKPPSVKSNSSGTSLQMSTNVAVAKNNSSADEIVAMAESINDASSRPAVVLILNPLGGVDRRSLICACNLYQNTLDIGRNATGNVLYVILRGYNYMKRCIIFNIYGEGACEHFLDYLRERCEFDITDETINSLQENRRTFVFDFTTVVTNNMYQHRMVQREKKNNSVIYDNQGVSEFLMNRCDRNIVDSILKPIPFGKACLEKTKEEPVFFKTPIRLVAFPDLLGVEEFNVKFQYRSDNGLVDCPPVEDWPVQYIKTELPKPVVESFVLPIASPSKNMRVEE